jgi:hypothetical protein
MDSNAHRISKEFLIRYWKNVVVCRWQFLLYLVLLATNRQEDQWEQVENSIGHGLGSNPAVEGMMRILSFSYFDLNPCLRSCLLYLSIFPEDAKIHKKDLILRWIVEGFIPEERGQTMYELGEVLQ